MSILTSQQISQLFEQYGETEITFTKEVSRAIRLAGKQVFLKCLGYQWPCIIYSSSMVGAKVIVNVKSSIQDVTRSANNLVSLRFGFQRDDKLDPIAFHVASRITGFTATGPQNPDLNFAAITFTQRPPDYLIAALGTLLEANANSQKRRDERVLLTDEVMRKLGLKAKEITLFVQGIPRKAILRDFSFSGAKLIILGVPKFLIGKEVILRIEMEDTTEVLDIPGTMLRHEPVSGRKDIAAFAIQFQENRVPMRYKLMVNSYLSQNIKRK